jgi:phospholipid transport system transporter-binding protein
MSTHRSARGDAGTGFVPEAGGARWKFVGPLTFADASDVFAAAEAMTLPTGGEVDLAGVSAVDSSAVAVLLGLKRRAADEGRSLAFTHMPEALTQLADLYGVEEMLAT